MNDTFEIEVADEAYAVDVGQLIDQLKIDPNDITDNVATQPGLAAWVMTLSAQADYDANRLKQDLVAVKAAVGSDLRRSNEGRDRRLTESAISDLVDIDDDVRSASDAYLEAARRAAIVGALREAFRQRYGMLQTLGFARRGNETLET